MLRAPPATTTNNSRNLSVNNIANLGSCLDLGNMLPQAELHSPSPSSQLVVGADRRVTCREVNFGNGGMEPLTEFLGHLVTLATYYHRSTGDRFFCWTA